MNAYLPFGLLSALALSFILVLRRRGGAVSTVSARQSLSVCSHLLSLIGHIQQHRGMSSALLSGDKSFAQRLSAKRAEIDGLFPALQAAAADELKQASPCLTPNDLALFRFKWRSLVDGLDGMAVDQSIAEHGQLIATALDWLDAFGEARVGLASAGNVSAGLVKNYAHRLPALTECLGQARAIGSSVAARGKCSAVARVRLMFLVSRAETLLDQASNAEGAKAGSTHNADAARVAVRALADLIRARMLIGDHVDVTADSYFRHATEAIECVFSWARDCGESLQRQLV